MRTIIVLTATVCALLLASTASASDWYWNEAKATSTITRYTNTGILDGGIDGYAFANCYGQGYRWRKMYKRFVCRVSVFLVEPVASRTYRVRIAVTGRDTFRVISGNPL